MIVEVDVFKEFCASWWNSSAQRSRADMVFCKMTFNTKYITWIRRWDGPEGFDFTDVHFADRGQQFTVDKSYEEMKEILDAL